MIANKGDEPPAQKIRTEYCCKGGQTNSLVDKSTAAVDSFFIQYSNYDFSPSLCSLSTSLTSTR